MGIHSRSHREGNKTALKQVRRESPLLLDSLRRQLNERIVLRADLNGHFEVIDARSEGRKRIRFVVEPLAHFCVRTSLKRRR